MHWRIKGKGGGDIGTCVSSRSNFFHFRAVFDKNLAKQECIPVGCLPPTAVAVPRVSTRHPPEEAPPRGSTPSGGSTPPQEEAPPSGGSTPPGESTPPGGSTPREEAPTRRKRPPRRMPPLWTKWQTDVKILPCPKLRLQVVIIGCWPNSGIGAPRLGNPGSATGMWKDCRDLILVSFVVAT